MSGSVGIYVDDTDPAINYSESGNDWAPTSNTFLNVGNFGPPYLNTLHGANKNASFTFSFLGTDVRVDGAYQGTDLPWKCFVDGVQLNNTQNLGWGPLMTLCQSDTLDSGPHTLKVVVCPTSSNQTVWFDRIRYAPPAPTGPFPVGAVVELEDNDRRMLYPTDQWQSGDGISRQTQVTGASMQIKFSGTSLTWISYVPQGFSMIPGPALYSVDEGKPVRFQTTALKSVNSGPLWNQVVFQTGTLPSGPHTLSVTFFGNSSHAPLNIDRAVIDWNGTLPVFSGNSNDTQPTISVFSSNGTGSPTLTLASSTMPSLPPQTTFANPSSSMSVPESAPSSSTTSTTQGTGFAATGTRIEPRWYIIGGAGGGFLLLVVLVILGLCYHRRRTRPTASEVHPYGTNEHPHVSTKGSLTSQGLGGGLAAANQSQASLVTNNSRLDGSIIALIPENARASNSPDSRDVSPARSPGSTSPLRPLRALTEHPSSANSGSPIRHVVHQDSGLRRVQLEVIDVPPSYTT